MADTNLTGSVYSEVRQGSAPVDHTFPVPSGTATTAVFTGITIKASASKPVIVEAQAYIVAADSGTTPTVSVGYTAANYTDLLNAVDTSGAIGFYPASNAKGKAYLTSDAAIYYKRGGTPTGEGSQVVQLRISTVNTAPVP